MRLNTSLGATVPVVAMLALFVMSALVPVGFGSSASAGHHPNMRITASTSSNWSGYAAESSIASPSSGYVQSVSGSWTVPTLTCSAGQATYVAVWVGIDGYSDSTVEQTGTEQQCSSGGATTYYAWYEMYPHPMFQLFTVYPGDSMSASVTYGRSGSFSLTITDSTPGHTNTATVTQTLHQAQLQSAEWIVEAPYSGGVLPLANFGTVSFTGATFTPAGGNAMAVDGGGSGSYDAITMVDSANGATSTPSPLTDSGTSSSFDCTYSAGSGTTTTTTTSSTSSTTTTTSTSGTAPSLSVSVATNQASYTQNSWAYITVTVTSSGTAVVGASVTVTVTAPNGAASTGSGTTNSNGVAAFKYRISPNAPLGTYTVDASASASGYGSGSGFTTFAVT